MGMGVEIGSFHFRWGSHEERLGNEFDGFGGVESKMA